MAVVAALKKKLVPPAKPKGIVIGILNIIGVPASEPEKKAPNLEMMIIIPFLQARLRRIRLRGRNWPDPWRRRWPLLWKSRLLGKRAATLRIYQVISPASVLFYAVYFQMLDV